MTRHDTRCYDSQHHDCRDSRLNLVIDNKTVSATRGDFTLYDDEPSVGENALYRQQSRFNHKEETMADVRINTLKNGPLEVTGGAQLFDHQCKEYIEDQIDPIYLCRCGSSKNKPF